MITTLAIANYRSIRQMVLPMARLNVVTGLVAALKEDPECNAIELD
jgi:predicted ATPase